MLLSSLNVNKYKDVLSITVEGCQEEGGKEG